MLHYFTSAFLLIILHLSFSVSFVCVCQTKLASLSSTSISHWLVLTLCGHNIFTLWTIPWKSINLIDSCHYLSQVRSIRRNTLQDFYFMYNFSAFTYSAGVVDSDASKFGLLSKFERQLLRLHRKPSKKTNLTLILQLQNICNLRKQSTFREASYWFPREMTSEERAEKFDIDDASLPKSG